MNLHNKTVEIIGAATDLGASVPGCDYGPKAIRQAGLHSFLKDANISFVDGGNILACHHVDCIDNNTPPCNCDCNFYPALDKKNLNKAVLNNLSLVNHFNNNVYKKVTDTLKNNRFPLVLGGDHSLAAGSVLAASDHFKSIGIIWVDAHGDFNNAQSSPSKNIHGMPLSALTGNGPNEILPFKSPNSGFILAKNAVIISGRDFDDEESKRIKDCGVTTFSMQDIDQLGIDQVIAKAIELACDDTDGVYLSFDLDAIDPAFISGLGTPVSGGLSLREAKYICKALGASKKLLAAEIVELNPLLDNCNMGGKVAVELILQLFT